MTDDLSAEAPTTWTASFSVTLPARCVLPSFGDAAAPCSWRIEQSGDVVWCHTHGGVDLSAEAAIERTCECVDDEGYECGNPARTGLCSFCRMGYCGSAASEGAALNDSQDPEFLRFVVEHLYDLIEGDLSGADGRGLDDALTTDDQIAYLRGVYDTWTRVYGRERDGRSEP